MLIYEPVKKLLHQSLVYTFSKIQFLNVKFSKNSQKRRKINRDNNVITMIGRLILYVGA